MFSGLRSVIFDWFLNLVIMGQFRERSEVVRVRRLLAFYASRGVNSERVNLVYRKVVNLQYDKKSPNNF